jgi:aspartate/methionine/tyrosine aminotransferase
MSNHTVYNVPVPMQRVALGAIREGAGWLASARAEYRATRDATARALDDLGLSFTLPRGGSFFFLDLAAVLGERPLQPLLERAIDAGVLLAPGEAFGRPYARYVRLCFTGVPRDEVLEGVRRFGRALEALS